MKAAALIAAFAGAVALAFSWQPGLASLHDDSVSYLVMAQAFAPYGPASPAISTAFAAERYPPLFPLLIAASGGAHDWAVAHALVALCFAASVLLLALLGREISGSTAIGVAAAIAYVLMPGTWLQVKGILSEFPYMALAFAALLAHARLRTRPMGRGMAFAMGLLLGAVLLMRTIGIALVAAIAFAEIFAYARGDRARLRRWTAAFAIALGLAGLWYVLRPSGGEDEYVTRSSGVIRQLAESPAQFAALVRANASALTDAWLNALLIFWGEPWQPRFVLTCVLGLAGLAACLYRAARGQADAAYVLVFLAILLAWPFPGQMYRLAWPVVPLLMLEAIWGAGALARRVSGEAAALRSTWAIALVALATCLPPIFYVLERAGTRPAPGEEAYRRTDIAEFYRIPSRERAEASAATQIGVFGDLERIRATTPANSRVMWYGPSYVALIAGRHGLPMDYAREPAALAEQVRRHKPDFIYFGPVHPRDSAARDGDALAPWSYARAYSEIVWLRARPGTRDLQAVLLQVDAARLPQ